MKKLFLVLTVGFLFACSSDEGNEPIAEVPVEVPQGGVKHFNWHSTVPNQYIIWKEKPDGTITQHDESSMIQVASGDKISVTCKIGGGMLGTYRFLNSEWEEIYSEHLHDIIPPSNHPYIGMGYYFFRSMATSDGRMFFTIP